METDKTKYLIEQYKIVADSLNSLRAVKDQTNHFHMATVSVVVAASSLISKEGLWENIPIIARMLIPSVGFCISLIWFFNIRSFGLTMESRYKVLHEMEKQLPFPCFSRALKYMGEKAGQRRLTKIEQFLPVVFGTAFVLLLVFFIIKSL